MKKVFVILFVAFLGSAFCLAANTANFSATGTVLACDVNLSISSATASFGNIYPGGSAAAQTLTAHVDGSQGYTATFLWTSWGPNAANPTGVVIATMTAPTTPAAGLLSIPYNTNCGEYNPTFSVGPFTAPAGCVAGNYQWDGVLSVTVVP